MSQRGGSVTGRCALRRARLQPHGAGRRSGFPAGAGADAGGAEPHCCGPGGVLITRTPCSPSQLPNKQTLNVALLGALSAQLPLPEELWLASLRAAFDETFFEGKQKSVSDWPSWRKAK